MVKESKRLTIPAPLANEWLTWQCTMVTGFLCGAIYFPQGEKHLGSATASCTNEGNVKGALQLSDAALQVLDKNSEVMLSQYYGAETQHSCNVVACPLWVENVLVAVVSVMITPRSESQQQALLRLLKWGGAWIKNLAQQNPSLSQSDPASQNTQNKNSFSLALTKTILKRPSSHMAAMDLANQMADQFGCERVSVGFRQGLSVRLCALSHVASFDYRTQLVRRIEAVMEEAVDQNAMMVHPPLDGQNSAVTRAHVELADQPGTGAICTIPLPGRSGLIGVVTLERLPSEPFDDEEVALCNSLVRVTGPIFDLKLMHERSFRDKAIEALLVTAKDLFGTAYFKLKIAALSFIALITILSLVDGTYEITAQASIEGSVRQLLTAPQNGYVKDVMVQAGNVVKKGQIMALLDDRTLQLERLKWQSEYNKIEREYQQALAQHNRIQLGILKAKIGQVKAELLLVDEKIKHTQLKAPFNGVVVSGDLSQSLGAPVEIGQVLFEVAILDSFRVTLEVEDRDIASVKAGIPSKLIIAALPNSAIAISIDQVIPIAVSSGMRNFFRVDASLAENTSLLLPGMRGIAKIEIGQRKILWIWTHALFDRIRLWLLSVGL